METTLKVLQLISAISAVILILIQNRGSGLGSAFGGGGEFYATKRGAEKLIGKLTIVAVSAFLVLSFLASVLND